ncbi:MAG: transglutaminase-like domain-containing protein [Myxococcaceae bacterium]
MDELAPSLERTESLDRDNPAIQAAVARVTAGSRDDIDRAVRIHDFVRDEVDFGWAPTFDGGRASATLARKVGFCNTKTPLFVTMLRAAGIPARIHFAGIDTRLLAPLIEPRGPYVDHSYAEVFLDGRWLHVDSYIVDLPFHAAALERLRAAGRPIGFGIHAHGRPAWDGRSDSFVQFVNDGSSPGFSDADFGIHADVPAFYASGKARTPRNPVFRFLVLRPILAAANRRVRALRARREAGPALPPEHA